MKETSPGRGESRPARLCQVANAKKPNPVRDDRKSSQQEKDLTDSSAEATSQHSRNQRKSKSAPRRRGDAEEIKVNQELTTKATKGKTKEHKGNLKPFGLSLPYYDVL